MLNFSAASCVSRLGLSSFAEKEGAGVDWLNLVWARIVDGTLLPAEYFGSLDCDAALDARDGDDAFVRAWMSQFEEVEKLWQTTGVGDSARKLAEVIRREAFLVVSRAAKQHEIASYVSDDFDIIVRGRLLGLPRRFLDRLWEMYERGEFPVPPL